MSDKDTLNFSHRESAAPLVGVYMMTAPIVIANAVAHTITCDLPVPGGPTISNGLADSEVEAKHSLTADSCASSNFQLLL
jgi:hypothetical protein